MSLDVFRGLTIAAMLLVNQPGNWRYTYGPLQHAAWHGWTASDLVFPFFLFIAGVSMKISFDRRLGHGSESRHLFRRALRRSSILIILGLLLASFPWWSVDLATLRIPGVLQRIGLSFALAAPIVLWMRVRWQAAVAVSLLVGYYAMLRWVPVPDVGAGVWEPGHDLGAYVDRMVFGATHLHDQSAGWDPEGLLGTIPAVATVLLGALAGRWLGSAERADRDKCAGLVAAAVVALALGLLWGRVFPINKNLWTSSFALFTAGVALLAFAACYWAVEVRGSGWWTRPFVLFGVNPIAVYVLSELAGRTLDGIGVGRHGDVVLRDAGYRVLFATWLPPRAASLAFALVCVAVWMYVMAEFDRRRIRFRI